MNGEERGAAQVTGLSPGAAGATVESVRGVVCLRGLRARGSHGVFAAERAIGQVFVADVDLVIDTRQVAISDDLDDTVDYATIATDVQAVLSGEPVALVETLAHRVAEACLAHAAVEAVTVSVHKPAAFVPVPFDDVVVTVRRRRGELLDVTPARPVTVVIGMGANAGTDPAAQLRRAVRSLAAAPALSDVRVSPVVQTSPVGGPPQPDYLNAVVRARARCSARQLLALLARLEDAAGRDRSTEVRWGPRTLDLDLLSVGSLVAADDHLQVPHPRAAVRAFVLAPWAQLSGDDVLPGAGRVADVLVDLLAKDPSQADGITRRPDVDLAAELPQAPAPAESVPPVPPAEPGDADDRLGETP